MTEKFLFYLAFLLSSLSYSQVFFLKGQVMDHSGTEIPFCNVTILNQEESKILFGTTTNENGIFRLENINTGDYYIKITYLGFENYLSEININSDKDLGTIVLNEKTESLKGVTITAKRPTIKRLVDRLVFNVENSTLSNNNILDVLKHAPGVFVSNDKITVKNGSPTIYINDRKVHLSTNEVQQLLEGTSASNIKSIEVITNPPAKYEAEGGAVINIITSKNIISGYNGSIFGNYKQGSNYPKYMVGTSHFFKTKKLNTYLNYSYSPRKDYRNNDEFINFIDNNQIDSRWQTDYKRTKQSAHHNINANLDYNFDQFNSIGFSSNILIAPKENTKTKVNSLTEVYSSNIVLDSLFNTENNSFGETFNLAFTLDYTHKFKKVGEKLSVSLHHTNYDDTNFQDVYTDYFLPDNNNPFNTNNFQTHSRQYIKLYTGQLDYELPTSETDLFEAGIKISSINSDNLLTQYTIENEVMIQDFGNTDTFLYDEMNYAGYLSYSKDWSKWNLKAGLRTEYTSLKGVSVSLNTENKKDYVKFFPSIHILKRFDSDDEIYFNYNRRIFRPRYSQLNPFRYYFNDNSFMTGDPKLKPQIDDVFTLGYTIDQKYTFEVYYRQEYDTALQIVFQDNEDRLIKYVNTNIDNSISYGLDFTTYTSITKNWDFYCFSSVFFYQNNFFALASNNELTSTNQWSYYGQFANYFSILKDKSLIADLSLSYISPVNDGPKLGSERMGVDINFKKTFFEDRASLNIGVTDIFNTQNFSETTKYLNQDIYSKSYIENRLFVIGFNYNFGNSKLTTNEKSIESEERERL
ncbi:outer membrane beta-barrel family protein [Gaetbulibacter saemankumensis]|uniref:outer membrane beta-barrel family protein n=1 Tax=Gaetbulibacter saemankumensis TaxID=311208 RepID=UPI0003F96A60|nr:outer membrane beta-barrel family protein [Gaetbulibacter saemankumensis]